MRAALAAAVLCSLAACAGTESQPAAPPTTTAADCRTTSGEPVEGSRGSTAEGSAVKLGPSSEITKQEAAREAPHRKGTPLILSGTVYTADCRAPAAGAVIYAWQTDARGVYGPGHGTENVTCCYVQGTVEADAEGRYTIETIKPGHYRGEAVPPPAHIHMEVLHADGGLLTEVWFAGDPHLPEGESGDLVVNLREESGASGKRLVGRFDIVLPSA